MIIIMLIPTDQRGMQKSTARQAARDTDQRQRIGDDVTITRVVSTEQRPHGIHEVNCCAITE
jgi:hypothetical protein